MPFTDDFNDTTGTFLENHTPSGGTAWTRIDGVAGGAKINSNKLASQTGGTNTAYHCDDQGSANQYVQYAADQNVGTSTYVCNRLTDSNNFIGVQRNSSVVKAYKCVAGTISQLGSNGTTTVNTGDIIKLESIGDVHKVYINGVEESGVGGTESFNNTETGQGVRCAASSTFNFADNFEAGATASGGEEALSGQASTGEQTAPSVEMEVAL